MKVILEKEGYRIGCEDLQYVLEYKGNRSFYSNITSLLETLAEKRIRHIVKLNSGLEGLQKAVDDTYEFVTNLSKLIEPKKIVL